MGCVILFNCDRKDFFVSPPASGNDGFFAHLVRTDDLNDRHQHYHLRALSLDHKTDSRWEFGWHHGVFLFRGDEIICFVKDNGMGIEEKYHKRIFGLFDKLDAASEGTGIGLAIVKRIIETHGGKIWVESEGLSKGSTFCFTIPDGRQQDS